VKSISRPSCTIALCTVSTPRRLQARRIAVRSCAERGLLHPDTWDYLPGFDRSRWDACQQSMYTRLSLALSIGGDILAGRGNARAILSAFPRRIVCWACQHWSVLEERTLECIRRTPAHLFS
jgi:hypothetical protein